MIRSTPALLILLFLPSLAGCIQPSGQPPEPLDKPTWGLGLEIPTEPPKPGPYIEGDAAIESLRAQIDSVAPQIMATCDDVQPQEGDYTSAWDGRLILAIQQLFSACLSEHDTEARQRATKDEASGQSQATYRELKQSAWAAFNASIDRISSLPKPGTPVEIAVQSTLQGQIIFLKHNLIGADSAYIPYSEGQGNYLNLVNAYIRLIYVINFPKLFDSFSAAWQWSEGSCRMPELDILRMEFEATTNDALLAIDNHGDPESTKSISFPEGALLEGIRTYRWALEQGWWPQVLAGLEYMGLLIRQVETAGDTSWPTREEAIHLIALHRSEGRSLYTEQHLAGIHENIRQNPDWEQFPNEARAALATPALQPRLALIQCTGPL